jgi:hypothetical protein
MENAKPSWRRQLSGAFLFAAVGSISVPAYADTWACEVTLCLANPKGPTAAAACVGPIKRLWRHLALGHAMPTCPDAQSSSNEQVRTEKATGEYCPAGYSFWGGRNGNELQCVMQGAVTTYKNGQPEKRTWWNEQGESLTEVFDQLQQAPTGQFENYR